VVEQSLAGLSKASSPIPVPAAGCSWLREEHPGLPGGTAWRGASPRRVPGGARQDPAGGTGGKELLQQKGRKLVFLPQAADLQNSLLGKVLDAFSGRSVEGWKRGGLQDPDALALPWLDAASGSSVPCPAAGFTLRNFFYQ